LPWLVMLIPSIAVLIRLCVVQLTTRAQSVINGGEPIAEFGYGYFVDAISTGLILIYILLIGFGAFSFSADRDSGVVRHLVIRSMSRRALVLAKFIALCCLAVLSVLLMLGTAIIVTIALWDLGPVVEDGFEIIGEQDILAEIKLGLQLALTPLPAALAFGVFVSVLSRSATQAVALAVGITLIIDLFKGTLGNVANYIFASFQPSLLDQSYLHDVSKIVRGFSDVLIDERVYQLNLWLPMNQPTA